MNMNKKAASLHQSMESWIELYKTIHECGHDEAHDAFDEWAEKLEGECADQTSAGFHDAVVASHAEMRKGFVEEHFPSDDSPYGITILDKPIQRQVSYTDTSGKVHTGKPVGDLLAAAGVSHKLTKEPIGGPLIELSYGKQPAVNKLSSGLDHKSLTMKDEHNPQGPIGGPILDTGKDPLAFTVQDKYLNLPKPQPVLTTEEVRKQLKNLICDNNEFIEKATIETSSMALSAAREVIATAESRLKMLDEVAEREKGRKVLGVSLKGKK